MMISAGPLNAQTSSSMSQLFSYSSSTLLIVLTRTESLSGVAGTRKPPRMLAFSNAYDPEQESINDNLVGFVVDATLCVKLLMRPIRGANLPTRSVIAQSAAVVLST